MTDPVPVNGTIELDGHQFRHRKDLSCRYVFIPSKAALFQEKSHTSLCSLAINEMLIPAYAKLKTGAAASRGMGRLPGHQSVYWRSTPVTSWTEAGADVAFADTLLLANHRLGINRVAKLVGLSNGTVQRIKGEMEALTATRRTSALNTNE